MRVRSSSSEAMVLCWKSMDCSLQVEGELLPPVKEFKYLWVMFTSEGKMEREMDRRVCVASAVMWRLCHTFVEKKELSHKDLSCWGSQGPVPACIEAGKTIEVCLVYQ